MIEPNPYIQKLVEENPLREPLLRSAIQAIHLPPDSHGLDVGCGIGLQTLLLADAVIPRGHVTGIDINPEMLTFGEEMVLKAGEKQRITLKLRDSHYP